MKYRNGSRSENLRGEAEMGGGHNLPPLVEIELTDLPKSGGAPSAQTILNIELLSAGKSNRGWKGRLVKTEDPSFKKEVKNIFLS